MCCFCVRGWLLVVLVLGVGLVGVGCQVPVAEQRLVSKVNMVFSDSAVFVYGSRVTAQVEPGSALSGGAQAAGCTACQ